MESDRVKWIVKNDFTVPNECCISALSRPGVWIHERRDLDLTKVLQSIAPCERVADAEWYSINGSKFAYCNSCQYCKKIYEVNQEQVFWNRLQVSRGSLLLTGIQKNDDGRTIKVKFHMYPLHVYTAHMYTIWIFVNTSRPPGNYFDQDCSLRT